jgi:ATP-dependent Clp protease adaptor protein ClpS
MSDQQLDWDHEGGLAIEEAKPELKPPKKYQVILINDDFTPMEFVVQILNSFFSMNQEQATQVMLMVHTKGKGICGEFTFQIAETKVEQVNNYSRQHQHPLLCTMEEV